MPTPKIKLDERQRQLPATQRVEAHLRKSIFTGKLRPRQRIIEGDLAQELGMSRGPVREALLRLERDGLVVTTSRRGTFIRDIAPAEISVIFRMRAKLEALCVRYMRENASIRPQELLIQPLEKMKTAVAKNNEEQFFHADMELHQTIWKAAEQPMLYRTLNSMMNPYIFIIARSYSSRIPLSVRRDNHEDYVRLVVKTPKSRVEKEVELYFEKLYLKVFKSGSQSTTFDSDHWAQDELARHF